MPRARATRSRTLTASAVTSTPIPSPGTTAIFMRPRTITWPYNPESDLRRSRPGSRGRSRVAGRAAHSGRTLRSHRPRDRALPRPCPVLARTLHAPPDPSLGRLGSHAHRVGGGPGDADPRSSRRDGGDGGALALARGRALHDAARHPRALRQPGAARGRSVGHRPDRAPSPGPDERPGHFAPRVPAAAPHDG